MFAIALWDRKERVLSLARDRMGEKPLYYGWHGRTFLFGSELKALRAHPDFIVEIDRAALELYIRRGYVPAPRSIYSGLSKLTPGSVLRIQSDRASAAPEPRQFWSLERVVVDLPQTRFSADPDASVRELEALLLAAIQRQQIADVPIGAFLSGGVDSSLVVALMQRVSAIPVRTYTIGFEEKEYDEASYARAVANHLGTDHTELYVSAQQAMAVIPSLPSIYDEPFADISQIPMTLVARLARRDVTVALSGDGGDELFAGYDRYANTIANWRALSRIPRPIRLGASLVLPWGPWREGLPMRNADEFYQFKNSQWKGFPHLVLGRHVSFAPPRVPAALEDGEERLMFADATNYLPDDILVKVDRAAMSCSLETRVPMLDHHVVEFAWRLPIGIKSMNGVGKWPLKQLLRKYVPDSLVNRPKMGFGVPMDHWLRGPLKDWAEDLLSAEKLTDDQFFDPSPIRQLWREHQSGQFDRHYGLWTVLMFQAWLQENR
jgi:asparagine synthase (glutamine-hydrolysing)